MAEKLAGLDVVHVMDREADIYELIADLVTMGDRFIIRSAQNRSTDTGRLFESAQAAALWIPGFPAREHVCCWTLWIVPGDRS